MAVTFPLQPTVGCWVCTSESRAQFAEAGEPGSHFQVLLKPWLGVEGPSTLRRGCALFPSNPTISEVRRREAPSPSAGYWWLHPGWQGRVAAPGRGFVPPGPLLRPLPTGLLPCIKGRVPHVSRSPPSNRLGRGCQTRRLDSFEGNSCHAK